MMTNEKEEYEESVGVFTNVMCITVIYAGLLQTNPIPFAETPCPVLPITGSKIFVNWPVYFVKMYAGINSLP